MIRKLGEEVSYNVPPVRQKMTLWCWAACLEMIARFYTTVEISQESFAIFVKQRGTMGPATAATNLMGGPEDIVACAKKILALDSIDWCGLGKMGNSKWPIALSAKNLIADLNDGRLMIVGYDKHARVVTGYKVVNAELYLYMNDPDDGRCSLVKYAAVQASWQYRVSFGGWALAWGRMIEDEDPGLS